MNEITKSPSEPTPEQLLRDGLRCLHLSGAIFLRAHFSAPWAYESPASEEIDFILKPGDRRVILFHIFTEGRCQLSVDRAGDFEMSAGDIVILPFADRHRLGDPDLLRPTPVREMLPPPPWTTMPVIHYGGGGTPFSMVCGYLLSDDALFNPVLACLPPLMRVRPSAGGPLARWVDASVQYALHAAERRPHDDDPLLQRLPELLFMECLCDYARQQPAEQTGWLGALADPVVGRALACMHRQPEYPWTLKELARRAAASRSILDERFRLMLGRAPMSYLIAWRLQLASRQLRASNAPLAKIAEAVGYGSEAAFSRAFKRHTGASPVKWRQSVAQAA
jgi:AraC-like DNA-binding protein